MGIFDGFAGAAVGALGGFLGASSANKQSAASTQAQIDFQRDMSNSQYQRVVADLNAAGLSPMLAYSQGGASTPQGSSYKAENVGAAAVEGAVKGSQPSLIKAQIEQAESQAQLNAQSAKAVAEQARKTAYEVDTMLPIQLQYEQALKGSQINANNATAGQQTALSRLTDKGEAPSIDPWYYRDTKKLLKYGYENRMAPKQYIDSKIDEYYNLLKDKLKGR